MPASTHLLGSGRNWSSNSRQAGKLLQKQGKNTEAIAAANKSLELLKDDKNVVARDEYIRLNQEVLAAAGAKK